MKKIFLALVCFISTASMLQAQDNKPTKEQTIAFLDRMVKSAVGLNIGEDGMDVILVDAAFEYNLVIYNEKHSAINRVYELQYSEIKWESFTSYSAKPRGQATCLSIFFNTKMKALNKKLSSDPKYQYSLWLYIQPEKIESVKKAIERLAEIAKEENKDPFAN